MKNIVLLILLVFVVGCVKTREPSLMPTSKNSDKQMSCKDITIEYKANTNMAVGKIKSNRKRDRKELWYGILIWPGLMDFKNADGAEANALLDRNLMLREYASSKRCNLSSWPAQPARY